MNYRKQVIRMKTCIWYNPELKKYEKGSREEYDLMVATSLSGSDYQLLYQFDRTHSRIVYKITEELNTAQLEYEATR